jgi:hypothetical protein
MTFLAFKTTIVNLNKKNMKKLLRSNLLAIISMIVPLGLQAQEDVTAVYLVNPGFELGPSFFHDPSQVISGWNISQDNLSDAFLNQNDGVAAPEGSNVFGVWSPGSIADMEISQTVKNLPAGTYSISCVLTVPDGGYSTQRLFASTTSAGTKSKYFGATSLAVVPGETYDYAGYAIDGDGNGPYHPMSISINVNAGEDLVFGIRSNGKLSTVCAFSALDGHGLFKVDDFKLSFIKDPNAFIKTQIQTKITTISAISRDSIPGGYGDVIDAKVTEAQGVILNQTISDSLDAYNTRLKDFILLLGNAKTKFLSLQALLMKAENLTNTTNFPGKAILVTVFDDTYGIYFSPTSLLADFNTAYSTLDLAIHTYIDGVMPENLATIGTPTTSFVSGWERLSAVNDGFEPINSGDRSHPVYGNWNGDADYGKTNWVEYDWEKFNTIQSVSIYWFSDGGGLAQPETATIEYWKDGAWVLADTIGRALDQWNTLAIANIKSQKLRANFSSLTSTGICEFKVVGLRKVAADLDDYKVMLNDELTSLAALKDTFPKGYVAPVTQLKQDGTSLLTTGTIETISAYITQLKAYRLVLDSARVSYDNLVAKIADAQNWVATTSLPNKEKLQLAISNATTVFNSTTSLKAEFNTSVTTLQNAINAYSLLSCRATVSTSLCSSWEKLTAVNDGYDPTSSKDVSHKRYGNWNGTDGKVDWVMYEWPAMEIIKTISIYWASDGGGLAFPDSSSIDYFDGTEWKVLGPIGAVGDQYNTISTDIQASKLKVTMKSPTATSIIEFKVVGYDAPTGIATVKQNNLVNVYPTMVKRGADVNVNFAKDLSKPVSVELFTISGQKVYNTAVSGRTSIVSVPSSLGSGIYLMVFNAPEGKLFKKIVVE